MEDFEDKVVRTPEVLKLAERVKVVVSPEFSKDTSICGPVKIMIKTKSGKEYSEITRVTKGHPQNELNKEELTEKFNECVKHSAKPIQENRVKQLLEMLNELEKVDQISKVISLTA